MWTSTEARPLLLQAKLSLKATQNRRGQPDNDWEGISRAPQPLQMKIYTYYSALAVEESIPEITVVFEMPSAGRPRALRTTRDYTR